MPRQWTEIIKEAIKDKCKCNERSDTINKINDHKRRSNEATRTKEG